MLSLALPISFAAAVAGFAFDPSAAETGLPPPAVGGPYEPAIVVEARQAPPAQPWTIRPNPRLERRYARRQRQPVNRIVLRF